MKLRAMSMGLVVLAVGIAAGCAPRSEPAGGEAAREGTAAIAQSATARGEYLVKVLACNDCHTPWAMTDKGPAPDMSRMLMGHPAEMDLGPPPPLPVGGWGWAAALTNTAFAGPWGISYAPNLTPHDTGLGVWSEDMFISAMRSGMHMGAGRPILPPMPWTSYAHLNDEDMRALFAHLKTIPPIENAAPQSVVAPQPGT